MSVLREAMLRADSAADDPHAFMPREVGHEAIGRALQVTREDDDEATRREEQERRDQAEQERRERREDATADAMEIVMRTRSRHGRTKWSRLDGRAVTAIVEILTGLVGGDD